MGLVSSDVLYHEPIIAGVDEDRCSGCGICVSVCPNLAMFSYRTTDREQPYQVAVLADLCNECGNCTTFCPTAGAPYRDKPRLYLHRDDFEAQADNAFMVSRDGETWSIAASRMRRAFLGSESMSLAPPETRLRMYPP